MDFVNREPIYMTDVEFDVGVGDDLLLDLFVKHLTFFSLVAFGKSSDDAKTFLPGHWKKSRQIIFSQIHDQRIVRKFPIDLHIRNIEQALECAAAEFNSQLVTNDTFCSVTSDKIFSLYRFNLARSPSYACSYAAIILHEIDKLHIPLNIFIV